MRKTTVAIGVLALSAAFSAQVRAASENYPVTFPGPQSQAGVVDDDDNTFFAPNFGTGTSCANDGNELANQYDTVPITNNGSGAATVVFTLSDVGGAACSFPNLPGHSGEAPHLTLYAGAFNPAQPLTNCRDVRRYSGSCPVLNFSVPPGATYTVVVSSNRSTPIPRPVGTDSVQGGSGLFGWQSGFGGSSPVSLQSFSVD